MPDPGKLVAARAGAELLQRAGALAQHGRGAREELLEPDGVATGAERRALGRNVERVGRRIGGIAHEVQTRPGRRRDVVIVGQRQGGVRRPAPEQEGLPQRGRTRGIGDAAVDQAEPALLGRELRGAHGSTRVCPTRTVAVDRRFDCRICSTCPRGSPS